MRAIQPRTQGFAINRTDGVRIHYEVFGQGERTIVLRSATDLLNSLFLPAWSIVHSRLWKMQVAYFARHFRIVTLDGRGNGQSERPQQPEAYSDATFLADALAVMDATQTTRADLVSLSRGARWALLLAAWHPERVSSAAFIAVAACPRPPTARLSGRPAAGHKRGLGQIQLPVLAQGLRRVPAVFLFAGSQRTALDQTHRGRRGVGSRHRS